MRDAIKQKFPKTPSPFLDAGDLSVEASLRWINKFQPHLELLKNPFETPFAASNIFKAPTQMVPNDIYQNKHQLPVSTRPTFTLPYAEDCTPAPFAGNGSKLANSSDDSTGIVSSRWQEMDLEPRPLGLPTQPTSHDVPTWNKALLSESGINAFGIERHDTSESQTTKWSKNMGHA